MQKSKRITNLYTQIVKNQNFRILSIDTSCDETAAAVTEGTTVLSNIIWSQASLHAKWGGVVPSIAKREHIERIDWIIEKAIQNSKLKIQNLDAIAVTVGPGLAIALEVGIEKAKEISKKYNKPYIPVNHIEGHLVSPLAGSRTGISKSKFLERSSKDLSAISKQILKNKSQILNQSPTTNHDSLVTFPTLGVVTSGGHTEVVWIREIGEYQIIAQTMDDALGESLDKAARLLGFGYPGGEILEKVAKEGNPEVFTLPIPMRGREKEMCFSYSGLKTAFVRLLKETKEKEKDLTKKDISNIAAAYQEVAFSHFVSVLDYILKSKQYLTDTILAGGGVMANVTLRKMLRQVARKYDIKVLFPYSNRLYGDNAAMIGIAANFKLGRKEFLKPSELEKVDRLPRAKVDKPFPWE